MEVKFLSDIFKTANILLNELRPRQFSWIFVTGSEQLHYRTSIVVGHLSTLYIRII